MARTLTNLELTVDVEVLRSDVNRHIREDAATFEDVAKRLQAIDADRWYLRGGISLMLVLLGGLYLVVPALVRGAVNDVLIQHGVIGKR